MIHKEKLANAIAKKKHDLADNDQRMTQAQKAIVKKLAAETKRKRKNDKDIIKKVESGQLDRYDIIKNAYDREARLKILNINLMSKEEIQKYQHQQKIP